LFFFAGAIPFLYSAYDFKSREVLVACGLAGKEKVDDTSPITEEETILILPSTKA
jgi:hypothetical protein